MKILLKYAKVYVDRLLSAGVLLAANAVTARVRAMIPRAERLLEGQPTLLVHDGKFVQEHLHHEGISEDDRPEKWLR
ncbi:MAG: hypothetical protein Q7R39_18540 [Dehalococcoidia bacterium]|nr:hypothetical protein [Dehalococcoidia bacterium]